MNKRLLILTLALISCGIVAQAQNSFAILVDSETYRHCKDEIEDYRESVANGGLDAFIIEKKWECPEEIKDTLIHFYNTRSLEGTVFVGDIPIPMIRQGQHFTSAFKMDEDSKYHAMRDTSVPSDRFYDDFNLKFQFVGRDSVETHFYYYNLAADSPQRIECDIYSGRIKPSSDRGDKYEELSRYLKKVVRLKKETNYLDKVTSYTGDGSFSNSLVAWKEETITLKEQMPQIYETGDGAKFMIFAMYPYMTRCFEGVVIIIIHIERCDNNRIIDSHKVNESIISILCKNILASTNTFIKDSRVVIVKFYLFTLRSLKGIIVSSNTSSHEDNLQSDTRHLCIRRTIVIGRSIDDLEQGRSHDSIDIEIVLINDSRNCNNYFNKIFIALIFNVVFNHKKSDSRGIEIDIFIGIVALLGFCFILSKILVVVI